MTADETSTTVNHGVVKQYMQQLRNVVQTGSTDDVELIKNGDYNARCFKNGT